MFWVRMAKSEDSRVNRGLFDELEKMLSVLEILDICEGDL